MKKMQQLFQAINKGKYTKSMNFLLIFITSFYFKELYSETK